MIGAKTRFICPFCDETLIETYHPYNRAIKTICLDHIKGKHPVRWRLSRKFRRAIKKTDATIAT